MTEAKVRKLVQAAREARLLLGLAMGHTLHIPGWEQNPIVARLDEAIADVDTELPKGV